MHGGRNNCKIPSAVGPECGGDVVYTLGTASHKHVCLFKYRWDLTKHTAMQHLFLYLKNTSWTCFHISVSQIAAESYNCLNLYGTSIQSYSEKTQFQFSSTEREGGRN